MARERTYPLLPCQEIDEAIAFYEALGFKRTYRQLKPYSGAAVAFDEMHIHLFGMEGFDPADSYGSVIVVVPDPDALYQTFAAGLRAKYGKLPVTGIPRILRPRKKFGVVYGFTVVDVGGNWLRIFRLPEEQPSSDEQASENKSERLAGMIEVAARLGDSKGDDAKALQTLELGLKRYPNAPTSELARAYLYRAELAVRLENAALAEDSLQIVRALPLDDNDRAAIEDELLHVQELVSGIEAH